MVEYTCERCKCTFSKKYVYECHLNRKIPCKPIPCNISVDDFQSIMTEMNKMKERINDIDKMEQQIKDMKKTIDKQNKTITKYEKCSINNSIDNLTVNNIDNSSNVLNVIAFGKEDLSFISDESYKKIMNRGYAAPSILTEHVHYNPNRPEYHNVYISNKKDKKHIHVFDGNKWVVRVTKDVIEELKLNASELIKAKMDILDPKNKKDASILKKIKRFVDSYDNDESLNDFDENYELMFYNNREMVKNTHSL